LTEPAQVFKSGYDPTTLMKRPVRSRMRGVVRAGGENPPTTRLADAPLPILKKQLESFLNEMDHIYTSTSIITGSEQVQDCRFSLPSVGCWRPLRHRL
jgi:hypothetical protein